MSQGRGIDVFQDQLGLKRGGHWLARFQIQAYKRSFSGQTKTEDLDSDSSNLGSKLYFHLNNSEGQRDRMTLTGPF